MQRAYPIDQSPIPAFHQKRELSEQLIEQTVLKDGRVWGGHRKCGQKNADLSLAPSILIDISLQRRYEPARLNKPSLVVVVEKLDTIELGEES